MKRFTVIIILASALNAFGQDTETGKKIFSDNCAICHTIGKGRLIGPDLAGVDKRREKDWVLGFIANSAGVIASGDKIANALFEEYNKLAMPAHEFSGSEMEDLYAYLAKAGEEMIAAATIEPAVASSVPQTLEANIQAPPWFIAAISFIGIVVLVLLAVIFMLVRMVRRLSRG